ncbi:hypothetical protein PG993_013334 [Apiospora rasikravindrae]|uniref:Uncharacterized protein n=1 Tax=Apiospora rasikravindrae TaxID=990691 RepID=A0ABR1RYK7_9PEZI
MEDSTNQTPGSRQQPQDRTGTPIRGFQSSRPFQFQPQPLSINTSAEAKSSSMHSASSSISSTSSAGSTFSSLSTSPTLLSPGSTLLSPASSIDSPATTTHIHKAPDGSLLMNRDYMSPASPVGEGFLDPQATRGLRAAGGVSRPAPRLHMNMQVSGGAELNMHVRGNVDMIFVKTKGSHDGARR